MENTNIRLAIIAFVLFLTGFFVNDPLSLFEETYASAKPLLDDFQSKDVQKAELFFGENNLFTLQKNESWTVTAGGITYPGDGEKIETVLSALEGLKRFHEISSNRERFAEFGLTDRDLKLKLYYKGKEAAFFIGKGGPSANSNLVRPESSDTVYSVRAYLQNQWNQGPDYFRYKKLTNFSPENIATAEIQNGKHSFMLISQNGSWTITGAGKTFLADPQKVEKFFRELTYLEGSSFYKEKSLGRYAGSITLHFKSNITEKLEFRSVSADMYIVKSSQNPDWQSLPEYRGDLVLGRIKDFEKDE